MKLRQIRNATTLVTLGEHTILIDPMFAKPGDIPGLRFFRGSRRANPLVPLPEGARELMETATAVLVTHEHPDHFDPAALKWARGKGLPVLASPVDAPNLRSKGLDVRVVAASTLGMEAEVVYGRHGRGALGWMMGPVAGFYFAHPDEPSLYITGDTVLTPEVQKAVERLKPDVILAPAGAANFGVGPDILFSLDELVTLTRLAGDGQVVFNHLEALDHCLTTRAELVERMAREGLAERTHVPADGEEIVLERPAERERPTLTPRASQNPGFQKWLTAKFAGT